MKRFVFGTRPLLEQAALALALAGCLSASGDPAAAQMRGGGHDDGTIISHEESDHIHPGEDHEGNTGRGLGPRWQGGGSSGERGGHEEDGHDDGEGSGDDHAGGHEDGEDHADGKRGPRYMGGRATETILTGRHSTSLEDRVFRGHGN